MKRIMKIFPLLACSAMLFACGAREPAYKDGDTYDISSRGDGSIKAKLHKIKGGFELIASGSGRTKSFNSPSDVPWHYISKRIIKLTIKDGIQTIGNNMFYSLTTVQGTMLPASVTAIGIDGFNENFELYSLSASTVENHCDAKIYLYQEEMPEESDVYWRYKNGEPTVWSTIKMLFVGNSFTYYYDIPKLVEGLAKSANEMISVDYVVQGSASLVDHASHTSTTGLQIYNKLLERDDFDYVVLQEQSTTSYSYYNNFKNAATSLANDVKATQKNCEVRLYSTWAFEGAIHGEYDSIPKVEKLIRDSYIKCANEVTKIDDVNFVGPAFTKVYIDYPSINLYYSDNKHPSMYGAYLSACVHVLSMIKGINIDNTDFFGSKLGQYINTNDPSAQNPKNFGDGVSESDARTLIEVAKETVNTYSIDIDDSEEE